MAKKPTIEEAFDYCLSNEDGLSRVELLNMFPEYNEELQTLLAFSASVSAATAAPPTPLRRDEIKNMLLQAATTEPARAALAYRGTRLRLPRVSTGLPLRPIWSAAAAVAMFVLFIWWSATSALADSPFYDVKLNTENFLGNFSTSPIDVAKHHSVLAQVRLGDIQAMQSQGKLAKAGKAVDNFDFHINRSKAVLDSTDGATRTNVAKQVYASSVLGDRIVGNLQSLTTVSPALQESLKQALTDTKTAKGLASQALVSAGISPQLPAAPNVESGKSPTPHPSQTGKSNGATASPDITSGTGASVSTRSATAAHSPGGTAMPLPGGSPSRTSVTQQSPTRQAPIPTLTLTAATIPPTTTHTPVAQTEHTGTPTPQATHTSEATSTGTAMPAGTTTGTPTTVLIPTHTPTHTPTNTPVVVPTITAAIPPTYTQVPPFATATSTPQHTGTSVPPTETPIAIPTQGSCPLEIENVDAGCTSASCVAWSAEVSNSSNSSVTGSYTVQLQIKQRGGGFHTITTQVGAANISPGNTHLNGQICAGMPSDTTAVKVIITISSPLYTCNLHEESESEDACGESQPSSPTASPTAMPTNTPRPTHTPRK